jgi:hypothetical protein
MVSNDNNGKRKLAEEAESSTTMKRLRLSNEDSSDSPLEKEMEVSSEEMSESNDEVVYT